MLTILNTSILTAYGQFEYIPLTLEKAKELVQSLSFQSAIGHESTAQIISTLLNVSCPVNRINYMQQIGDLALVFKLNGRPAEGKILTQEEIEKMGYSWGLIVRQAWDY
jgi:hypothetical protein